MFHTCSGIEMTGRIMPPSDLLPARLFGHTLAHGLGTTRVEAAAGRWMEGTWHIATEEDTGLCDAGLGRGHRREQGLRCHFRSCFKIRMTTAFLMKNGCYRTKHIP